MPVGERRRVVGDGDRRRDSRLQGERTLNLSRDPRTKRTLQGTPTIFIKDSFMRCKLVKMETFTKQFISDTSVEVSSLSFTVSLIEVTVCLGGLESH